MASNPPAFVNLAVAAGLFGTGTDGAVTFDGVATPVAGATLAGSTYTLTRDIQATSMTINATIIVVTAGYRIFASGTLTNNGTISQAGNPAAAGIAGGALSGAVFIGAQAGGNGGTGASGSGANGTNANYGGSGGAGGAGTSGAAGTGGTATVSVASATVLLIPPWVPLIGAGSFGALTALGSGAGGGGGGSDAASHAGGGGGGGGGIIAIYTPFLTGTGTITAAGGAGAAGVAGNAGGGGGGAGGFVLTYTSQAVGAGQTMTAAGGALGAGSGTGANGHAGAAGLVQNTVL